MERPGENNFSRALWLKTALVLMASVGLVGCLPSKKVSTTTATSSGSATAAAATTADPNWRPSTPADTTTPSTGSTSGGSSGTTNPAPGTGSTNNPTTTPSTTPSNTPTQTPAAIVPIPAVSLVDLLSEPQTGTQALYSMTDSTGRGLDGLHFAQDPSEGFVGVYHTLIGQDKFCLRIATTKDLNSKTWTYRRDIDCDFGSQGEIKRLPDGKYLLAYEKNPSARPYMRFLLFSSIDALLANTPERDFSTPVNPAANAEGTPGFRWIRYDGNPDTMVIEVGYHFNSKAKGHDLNAIGFLRGFKQWDAYERTELNALVAQKAAWHIGDRAFIVYNGRPYTLVEAMTVRDDWKSWRLFLYDELSNSLQQISFATPKSSPSHGNPTLNIVQVGNELRVVGTTFVFESSEGGAHLFQRAIVRAATVKAPEMHVTGAYVNRVYDPKALNHRIGFAEADGWSVAATSGAGHMIFGPYDTSLPHAPMVARFDYLVDNNTAENLPVLRFEVYDASTGTLVAEQTINRRSLPTPFQWARFSLPFDWRYRGGHALEVRAYSYGISYIKIGRISVSEF